MSSDPTPKATFLFSTPQTLIPPTPPQTHILPPSSITLPTLQSLIHPLPTTHSQRPLLLATLRGTHDIEELVTDSEGNESYTTTTITDFHLRLNLDSLLTGRAKLTTLSPEKLCCRGTRKPCPSSSKSSPPGPPGESDPRDTVTSTLTAFAASKSSYKVLLVSPTVSWNLLALLKSKLISTGRKSMVATSVDAWFTLLGYRHEIMPENWTRALIFPGELERRWVWKRWEDVVVEWEVVEEGVVEEWWEKWEAGLEERVRRGGAGDLVGLGEEEVGREWGDRAGGRWWRGVVEGVSGGK